MSTQVDPAVERVAAWLASRPSEAFFLSEVEVALGREGLDGQAVAAAVERLEAEGRAAVARYTWDDPHLPGAGFLLVTHRQGPLDPGCAQRLDAAWGRWLRDFLASHRCT
jgi:hypothetical protein